MIPLKDGIRSLVRIDFKGRVHKEFRGTNAKERCENEVLVLKALEERGCTYVPRLLEFFPDEDYIVTTNCGKTAENTISRKKADTLFKELEEKFGVKHDDPEPRNITYDDKIGRFCIIDFELAEVLPLPKNLETRKVDLTRLIWSSSSVQGKRHQTNQDSSLVFSLDTLGQLKEATHGEILLPSRFSFFAVSDGVGGNNGGEFASKLVLKTLRYLIEKQHNPPFGTKTFLNLLQKTHDTLNQKATQNAHASRLSATFVGMILQEDKVMWTNVGDSRLYLLRNGELMQLSRDHNFAFRQWKRGEISEYQYRNHPRANVLFDCMGGGHPTISPEYGADSWEPGDRYLICSDGIIDGLSDKKLKYLLAGDSLAEDCTSPNRGICDSILKEALFNAGSDDTTLIVVDVV